MQMWFEECISPAIPPELICHWCDKVWLNNFNSVGKQHSSSDHLTNKQEKRKEFL